MSFLIGTVVQSHGIDTCLRVAVMMSYTILLGLSFNIHLELCPMHIVVLESEFILLWGCAKSF